MVLQLTEAGRVLRCILEKILHCHEQTIKSNPGEKSGEVKSYGESLYRLREYLNGREQNILEEIRTVNTILMRSQTNEERIIGNWSKEDIY